jgi:Ca2+-binding EF-hand superfamily protein
MKMNEIFKAFDRNYDGVLSKEELIGGFKQAYGSQHLAIQEVAFILSKLDLNGLQELNYSGKIIREVIHYRILAIND